MNIGWYSRLSDNEKQEYLHDRDAEREVFARYDEQLKMKHATQKLVKDLLDATL
jgi:hypothetical protein